MKRRGPDVTETANALSMRGRRLSGVAALEIDAIDAGVNGDQKNEGRPPRTR